jgi:hypothetical protein
MVLGLFIKATAEISSRDFRFRQLPGAFGYPSEDTAMLRVEERKEKRTQLCRKHSFLLEITQPMLSKTSLTAFSP